MACLLAKQPQRRSNTVVHITSVALEPRCLPAGLPSTANGDGERRELEDRSPSSVAHVGLVVGGSTKPSTSGDPSSLAFSSCGAGRKMSQRPAKAKARATYSEMLLPSDFSRCHRLIVHTIHAVEAVCSPNKGQPAKRWPAASERGAASLTDGEPCQSRDEGTMGDVGESESCDAGHGCCSLRIGLGKATGASPALLSTAHCSCRLAPHRSWPARTSPLVVQVAGECASYRTAGEAPATLGHAR